MGGVGRRNKKKAEKTKVQLKKGAAAKTAPGKHLPKGTNVTKTEFKVGKIVIPKQLERSELPSSGAPVTKKKLGLKEVLAKLGHFSQSVRMDAIEGLKELVTGEQGGNLVAGHLAVLIAKLGPLIADKEGKVRKSGQALMEAVIGQAEAKCLEPLYNIISAHLSCSLTHIDPAIQRDALKLIDSLTQVCPDFIATNYTRLLPDCLEQISARKAGADSASGGNSIGLASNMSEKLTAVQWRIDVLSRVDNILQTVIALSQQRITAHNQSKSTQLEFCDNLHCGFFADRAMDDFNLALLARVKDGSASDNTNNHPLLQLIDKVVPLIIETMMEATGMAGKNQKPGHLVREVAPMLTSSAGILHNIILLAELQADGSGDGNNLVVRRLTDRYLADLQSRIMVHVPYSSPEGRCHQENLQLCSIYLTLVEEYDQQFLSKIIQTFQKSSSNAALTDIKIRLYRQLLLSQHLADNVKDELVQTLVQSALSPTTTSTKDRIKLADLLSELVDFQAFNSSLTLWFTSIPNQIVECNEETSDEEVMKLLSVFLTFSQMKSSIDKDSNYSSQIEQLKDWISKVNECRWKEDARKMVTYIQQNFTSPYRR